MTSNVNNVSLIAMIIIINNEVVRRRGCEEYGLVDIIMIKG